MIISDQILDGNKAETFVAYLLSNYCLTRPVSSGTDIGIDLYCELIRNNKPDLHFWVQVKSTKNESIRILQNGKAFYSFKTQHLAYWKAQPVPVFAFLIINTDKIKPDNYFIHVVNVTEYLLNHDIRESKTQSLQSNAVIHNDKDLKNFLFHQVDITSARQKLDYGIISPTPSTKNEYVKKIYPSGSSKFADKILDTIRSSTSFILEELINLERKNPDDDNAYNRRKKFARILEVFNYRLNWEVHYYLGLSYLQDKEYPKAKTSFDQSLKIIRSDKNIVQKDWEPIKVKIKKLIKKINHIENYT